MSRLLTLVYALLYPACVVSVFDADAGIYGEYVALPNFTNTWSTCGGRWPRVQTLYGRDLLVEVCDCRRRP